MLISRFAPSPTGLLHLGHAYSALLAHDFAARHGGIFKLRIEDIDPGRTRSEHVDAIIEDLSWLGVAWQGEILFQSRRLPVYGQALDRLRAMDLLYPCFCTRASIAAEVAASAAAPHGPEGAVYPGTCRVLGEGERRQLMAERPHAWRLDMARAATLAGTLYWHDDHTEVVAEPEAFGDVVLARKDAPTSYHLAVTIDDAAQGVTDVVRGRDLYAATDIHRLLQALLDLPTPTYHHHSLLADAAGRRLAKRHGAPTLADLRLKGVDPKKLAEDLRGGRLPAGYSAAGA
ncbi:tRNA glutamyl-Q(34) synthetase GluQRS [Sphingosinicella rhizophila]|uniref:tRNA glutamyl-Q(34) synthetase GluQRS n=1 Tax=Sphingosinicella rhizophila TaxID=3050082 RepID=A0ABU3Q951_9SPHN|nr:tRNA glutamyl-Q(34) synthetase GluQRS [Sphingosinicella sp. GR2756]MDT9599470.1 tRNA glutamyl-Q(34) synthetase GluQRS [Sphingosinicella sp. GR2756]